VVKSRRHSTDDASSLHPSAAAAAFGLRRNTAGYSQASRLTVGRLVSVLAGTFTRCYHRRTSEATVTDMRVGLVRSFLTGMLVLGLVPAGVPGASIGAATWQAPLRSGAVDEELEKARQLLQGHDYFNALKGFQRANQLAGGKSAEAFLGMAQAMQGMKVYKNALDACQSAIEFADDARVLARAHKLKGQVFDAMGDLRDAEAEFRLALSADPNAKVADLHYELGVVLMSEHRDDEAIAELQKEIELRPNGTTAEEARAIIANPRRGREQYAPAFSIVSADGQPLSLEALKGKVVLLDFWASWCGPCVRALPSVRKMQKDHAMDPFVVVGISADRDQHDWRAFTAKNGMIWPQYWDRDHRLQQTFGVTVIPTYVLIDGEGVEQQRVAGAGFDQARTLVAQIGRLIGLASPVRR
jgi:thiol-disulfide isomerase/thioredoxin